MKGARLYHVNFDRQMPAFRHRSPFPYPFDALLMHPFPRGAQLRTIAVREASGARARANADP